MYSEFFIPTIEISKNAIGTHGLTKKKLKKLGAREWTKGASEMLVNFLNIKPDLPIVCHGVKYDRDKVLLPAFKRVDNVARFPPWYRWRCTLDYAERLPSLDSHHLDYVLERCGFKARREGSKHDARFDAKLVANCYMHLVKLPIPRPPELGFCKAD